MSSDDFGGKRAACLGMDPALFFPGRKGDDYRQAFACCATCPPDVRVACLDAAYSHPYDRHNGAWGGTTPADRDDRAKAYKIARNGRGAPRPCETCGQPVAQQTFGRKRRHCLDCRPSYLGAPCRSCGVPMPGEDARYCSELCRRRAANERRAAQQAERAQ